MSGTRSPAADSAPRFGVIGGTRLRLSPGRFGLLDLTGRGVGSGPVAEGGETLAGEVRVNTFASRHGQDQRGQRAGDFKTLAVAPVDIGGPESQSGDPPFRADQEVR